MIYACLFLTPTLACHTITMQIYTIHFSPQNLSHKKTCEKTHESFQPTLKVSNKKHTGNSPNLSPYEDYMLRWYGKTMSRIVVYRQWLFYRYRVGINQQVPGGVLGTFCVYGVGGYLRALPLSMSSRRDLTAALSCRSSPAVMLSGVLSTLMSGSS